MVTFLRSTLTRFTFRQAGSLKRPFQRVPSQGTGPVRPGIIRNTIRCSNTDTPCITSERYTLFLYFFF